jgi:hypothetical protein
MCTVAGILLGLLIGYFAIPPRERWRYEHTNGIAGSSVLVRIDKQTGKTELFSPYGGWRPPFPSVDAVPLLPATLRAGDNFK